MVITRFESERFEKVRNKIGRIQSTSAHEPSSNYIATKPHRKRSAATQFTSCVSDVISVSRTASLGSVSVINVIANVKNRVVTGLFSKAVILLCILLSTCNDVIRAEPDLLQVWHVYTTVVFMRLMSDWLVHSSSFHAADVRLFSGQRQFLCG